MRSHPWTTAIADGNCRYYDLVAFPALIRTSLEDLIPWQQYAGVEQIYQLLEQINIASGPLQTNDCEFSGPSENDSAVIDADTNAFLLNCSGRIMILCSDELRNHDIRNTQAMESTLSHQLRSSDPLFKAGLIATAVVPVYFVASKQNGFQLMISFWAWGNDEAQTMSNLARLIRNLRVGICG
jgi:hypothetical protein